MKKDYVMFLWLDMVKGSRSSFKNNQFPETTLEKFQKTIGGTYYTNAYTITPDTFRTFGVFRTGLYPKNSEIMMPCNPDFQNEILKEKRQEIFEYYLERGYDVYILTHPILESRNVFFNKKLKKYYQFNNLIEDFKQNKNLQKVIFYYAFDYHELCGLENTVLQERRGRERLGKSLFNNLEKIEDEFDKIILFSDHGYTLEDEVEDYFKLDDEKTNILFQIRESKEEKGKLKKSDKLVSTLDIFPTVVSWNLEANEFLFDGVPVTEEVEERVLYVEDGFCSNRGEYFSGEKLKKYYKVAKINKYNKEIYNLENIDKLDKKLYKEFKEKLCFFQQNILLNKSYYYINKGFEKVFYNNDILDKEVYFYEDRKNYLKTNYYADGILIKKEDYYVEQSYKKLEKERIFELKKLIKKKDYFLILKHSILYILIKLRIYKLIKGAFLYNKK